MVTFRARRVWVLALTALLWAPALSWAQADGRPQRLVVYFNEDTPRIREAVRKLELAFQTTGVAARHRIVLRHVVVDFSKWPETEATIRQWLQLRPAAVITPNSECAAIARSATRNIPIIFASHQDPIALGLVNSLARPGANLTGFTYFVAVDQKRLELLRQLSPGARTLGILIDRWWLKEWGGDDVVANAKEKHGFEPELFLAETSSDLERVLSSPKARRMDAWYVPYTILPDTQPNDVSRLVDSLRKPVMFANTAFVENGGLISYQQKMNLDDSLRIWATMVGLVLDGVSPADIPIERPKSFELAVNLDAAKRLGLAVPRPLIKRADRVFFRAPP